jgi:ferredoxin/flavodoxin
MKILAGYFTGTGNTERCLSLVAEKLRERGHSVTMKEFRFSSGTEFRDESPELSLFAFPMLGFSPPQVYLRWIKALPKVKGGKAVVVAVCGSLVAKGSVVNGYSGDATAVIAGVLRKKGFEVVGTYEVSYPENWTQASNPPDDDDRKILYDAGDAAVAEIADDIVNGSFRRLNRPGAVALGLTVGVLFRSIARRFLGLVYVADENCTGCGVCAASCPVSTIRMAGKRNANGRGARPSWQYECQACNRCINVCPTKAIQVSPLRLFLIAAVNLALLVLAIKLADLPASLLALSGVGGLVVSIVSGIIAYIALSAIQIFAGTPLMDLFGGTRFGSRLFLAGSWTRGFRRYTATGFKIPVYWKKAD